MRLKWREAAPYKLSGRRRDADGTEAEEHNRGKLWSDEQEVDRSEEGGGGLSHAALKRQLTEAEREAHLS